MLRQKQCVKQSVQKEEDIVEEALSSSLFKNESFMLPAPTKYSDRLTDESSEDDEDYEGEAWDEEISVVYQ